VLKKTENY